MSSELKLPLDSLGEMEGGYSSTNLGDSAAMSAYLGRLRATLFHGVGVVESLLTSHAL